jgi:hypothetical protein
MWGGIVSPARDSPAAETGRRGWRETGPVTGRPPLPEFRPPRAENAEAGKPPGGGPVKAEPPAGGTAQEWRKVARRLARVAAELEALAGELPEGEAAPEQAKAMRSEVGRISQHTGVFKRRLGIGK